MRLLFLLFFLPIFTSAKNKITCKEFIKAHEWQINALNAGIGMPPHFINGRLQPGLNIGLINAFNKKKSHNKTDYNIHLGYFAQQSLQRVIYVKPGLGYYMHVYKFLNIRPSVNLALMAVRQTNKEFNFDNGQFTAVSNKRFQCMPSLALETRLPLTSIKNYHCSLLLKYEFGVQLPFSKLSAILPINQLHVGFHFNALNK